VTYQTIAFTYLQELADTLENNWDVDYIEGALLIRCPQAQFLLNYHGVMDQIWLSSPISGAHHFSYRCGKWLCTRTDRELESVLRQDLNA
jgi:iron donor protein CyaY